MFGFIKKKKKKEMKPSYTWEQLQPLIAKYKRIAWVPEIAEHAGHSYSELVDWMVKDASCDR